MSLTGRDSPQMEQREIPHPWYWHDWNKRIVIQPPARGLGLCHSDNTSVEYQGVLRHIFPPL